MRRKLFLGIAALAVAAVAGYNVYQSRTSTMGLSDLALANVEALAKGEMDILCDGSILIACEKRCVKCFRKWTAINGRGYSLSLIGTCVCGTVYQ